MVPCRMNLFVLFILYQRKTKAERKKRRIKCPYDLNEDFMILEIRCLTFYPELVEEKEFEA